MLKFVIYLTSMSSFFAAKKNTRRLCWQLKMAKVTRVTNSRINIGYNKRHRAAPTAELHSFLAHDIGHVVRSHCPMKWKCWKVMPDEIKMEVHGQLSMNYNLEDLNDESLAYVNRLFSKRYKQWKRDLHHYFEAFDDLQVTLQEGCPKELEGGMIVGRGSKFPEIDVYVPPGNELAESLHYKDDDGGEEPVGSSGVRLPTSSTGCWVSNLDGDIGSDSREKTGDILSRMGNARRREPRPHSSAQSNSQVTALTAQVATLQSQMSVILQSLAQSGIPIPHFNGPTSEPVHPEHPHQTTAL
ncbi:hypothetical protein Prudu_180S000400 [Prunus dulcis]|uniref:Ankyrin repeat family protein n=1 Tax=Prunus dulcis TaxID=3755 RepID=A0A5H2XMZ0_PRUDU|nr:hypothetical protein Prudu_180S000400 [Prunus dulcis]